MTLIKFGLIESAENATFQGQIVEANMADGFPYIFGNDSPAEETFPLPVERTVSRAEPHSTPVYKITDSRQTLERIELQPHGAIEYI